MNLEKGFAEIPIDKIDVFISRKRDSKGHELLTESIKKYGLLIPITVVKLPEDRYKLVKGQGRLLAHQKLGLTKIKAFVFKEDELPDKEIIENWLIENEVRDKLSNLDKARLMQIEFEKNKSYEETAKLFLTAPSTVRQYIGMLDKASDKVIRMIEDRKISFTQGKELAMTIKTKDAQDSVVDVIANNRLSQPASRIVLEAARNIEQKGQKVTIQMLEKNFSALRAENKDLKLFLGALQQRYNRIVPHVKALVRDPEFVDLLKKNDLPLPDMKEEVSYAYKY
ncbi:MAG: ParB/RepB/Spo0J family partition protein [Candidatus Omnitrophica bacterium]|nr:ParB/RepB/Spo0J family partition protein [Candidatus Omnitrophota bacterium]